MINFFLNVSELTIKNLHTNIFLLTYLKINQDKL